MGYTKKERQFYNGGDYCDAVAGDERNLRAVRRYFGLHSLVSWATINRAVDSIRYDLTEEKKQKKKSNNDDGENVQQKEMIYAKMFDDVFPTSTLRMRQKQFGDVQSPFWKL